MMRDNAISVVAALGTAGLLLASCALFESWLGGGGGPARASVFSHRVHVAENDIACADCHQGARKEAAAGMPSLAVCLDCHKTLEPGSPLEAAVRELRRREAAKEPLWNVSVPAADLKFDHARHAGGGVTYELPSGQRKPLSCADCHGDVGSTRGDSKRRGIPMELCTDCHARGRPAREGEADLAAPALNDCAVCHETFRKDRRPGDHLDAWRSLHGQRTKAGFGKKQSARCGYCHEEGFCTACHQVEAPRDHGSYFRLRGHGLDVALDRTRCTVCHLEGFCRRCHTTQQPRSHAGGWARAPYRHCTSCHLPLGIDGTGCAVCHEAADHSFRAPAYPRDANHTGGCAMACHTGPHPDPGPACKSCHK
jgi:hypothetical protein